MAQQQSWGNYRLPKGLIADLSNTPENTRLGNGLVTGRKTCPTLIAVAALQTRHTIRTNSCWLHCKALTGNPACT